MYSLYTACSIYSMYFVFNSKTWATVGTSSGVITCWDMRFQLPIVKCTHPAEARIRHLVIPPHYPGSVLAAVQGNFVLHLRLFIWWQLYKYYLTSVDFFLEPNNNRHVRFILTGNNEVGLWSLQSQYRQKVLWASSAPALSTNHSSTHSVSAIHAIQTVNNQGSAITNILTAGTDMRIRFWDLQHASNSEIITFGAEDPIDRSSVSYKLVYICSLYF